MRWAVATSGYAATARPALRLLGLSEDTPMVTREELERAGAYRVYADPAEMLNSLDELGVRDSDR